MGLAFTDVLIELSTPSRRAFFKQDPQAFLSGRLLTESEVAALISGEFGAIWRHAKSTSSTDPAQQFNRHDCSSDLLIEIEPVVEMHMEHNDQIAVHASGHVVVDEDGRFYRVVADDTTEMSRA